jgi:PAS domain S-box-containing protein
MSFMRSLRNPGPSILQTGVLAEQQCRQPIPIEADYRRKVSGLASSNDGDTVELGEAADISLPMSERHLRALFHSQPEGIAILSARGLFVDANPAAERILGLSRSKLLNLLVPNACFRATDAEGKEITTQNSPVLISLLAGRTVLGCVVGIYNPERGQRRWVQVDAIPHICVGDACLSEVFAFFSDITDKHMLEILPLPMPPSVGNVAAQTKAIERMSHLTRRERQVLQGLVDGESNKLIAFALGISPRTVEIHRARMMLKLEVRHFADAIRIAINAETDNSVC